MILKNIYLTLLYEFINSMEPNILYNTQYADTFLND